MGNEHRSIEKESGRSTTLHYLSSLRSTTLGYALNNPTKNSLRTTIGVDPAGAGGVAPSGLTLKGATYVWSPRRMHLTFKS